MSATALLHPREARAGGLVAVTARAFRTGPYIHPARAAYDFYPTPPEATLALLSAETFDGSVWEPACGEGHIAKVLAERGHQVIATDLVDHGFGQSGRDFLAEREPLAKHIITNPPYGRGLGDAFCRHAIGLTAKTGGKVAMLLPVQSLCHPLRHPFFIAHPPAVIYALDECHCWPYGDEARATRSLRQQRYCWMVWKHTASGETLMRWLSTAPHQKCPSNWRVC